MENHSIAPVSQPVAPVSQPVAPVSQPVIKTARWVTVPISKGEFIKMYIDCGDMFEYEVYERV